MLQVFGFERVGVVVSDLYFVDPDPGPGQEGPEQGVRLELRLLARGELRGSIYSATPIEVDQPLWRVDLLESVANPGSLDRAHHHPRFRGWEPGRRTFAEELSADPFGWLEARLGDPASILAEGGVEPGTVPESDLDELRRAAPDIVAATRRLLDRVRAGELARPPEGDGAAAGARVSWL